MKHSLIILLLVLSLTGFNCLTEQNIVIGIYTQKYFYGDHEATIDAATLTYIAPTYVNLASMAGAKVVPIYSYLSQNQIMSQLEKVNGIIFTGGEEWIYINTTWTKNAEFILNYAQKQNDQGKIFPILGICQGLELMLYLTSDHRADFLDSIQGQNGVWNTMKLLREDYFLIDGVSDEGLEIIQDPSKTKEKGIMYFFHSNGTLQSTFDRDTKLNSFWNLMGTTTSTSGQTVVSYLQAKQYPFYLVQFHPQRLSFNSQLSDTLFYYRVELSNTIALNFAMKCKQSLHRYSKEDLVKNIIDNNAMYDSVRFPDYKVYLFNEVEPGKEQDNKAGSVRVVYILLGVGVALVLGVAAFIAYKKRTKKTIEQDRKGLRQNQVQQDYQNDLIVETQSPGMLKH